MLSQSILGKVTRSEIHEVEIQSISIVSFKKIYLNLPL